MRRVVSSPIDEQAAVRRVAHTGAGAVVTFAGTVRDHNRGRTVVAIEYHAYEEMASREIEQIEAEAVQRWPGIEILILHRIGRLELGEVCVFLVVAAAHRKEGFEALRFAIDTLKQRVPIWKKEIYSDGVAWIEGS